MYEEFLQQYGLSEREAKTYLALLKLGKSSVGPIAKETSIQHSKIYPTLEKLQQKGLVSSILINKTKNFQARNPKRISDYLNEQKRQFEEKLPELMSLQNSLVEPPSATVFQGIGGLKAMFAVIIDNLKEGDYYYAFAYKDAYKVSEKAKTILHKVHLQLNEKGVTDRLIAHETVKEPVLSTYKEIPSMEMRFLSFNVPIGLIITRNDIVIGTWDENPTVIKITSHKIAEQYTSFFDSMWELGKE